MSVTAPAPRLHWIVKTHWVVRCIAFPATLLFLAIHLWEQDPPPLVWLLLVVQFLLYPHLLYLRARRADNPRQAELQHLWLDSFLFGAWAAWLGFPLFIAFTLFISITVNSAIFRGVEGILWALGLFAAGALLGGTLGGWQLRPDESPLVMLLFALGLSFYLLSIGVLAHRRTLALRQTREALKVRESEMGVDEAYERAQALRQAFAALEMWVNGARLNLSLSVGVAVGPLHANGPDLLIQQADLALYAAKAQGRNRVQLAEVGWVGGP